MSLLHLSPGSLQNVVALQGSEIIRLKAALADAAQDIIALRNEIKELRHERSVLEHTPTDLQQPSYDGETLQPFDAARYGMPPRRYLRATLHSLGAPRPSAGLLNVRDETVRWEDAAYDSFSMIKPESRLAKNGTWQSCGNTKMRGSVEVLGRISGSYYYLGRYEACHDEALAPDEYASLSAQMQDTVLGWTCSKKNRARAQPMLMRGEVPLRRFFLRRESFNRTLYDRLLSPAPGQILVVAGIRAEHGESDDEDASERD